MWQIVTTFPSLLDGAKSLDGPIVEEIIKE